MTHDITHEALRRHHDRRFSKPVFQPLPKQPGTLVLQLGKMVEVR